MKKPIKNVTYVWTMGLWTVHTRLVKNGVWRWYSTSDNSGVRSIRSFSVGSNALTHRGAIKEARRKYEGKDGN